MTKFCCDSSKIKYAGMTENEIKLRFPLKLTPVEVNEPNQVNFIFRKLFFSLK